MSATQNVRPRGKPRRLLVWSCLWGGGVAWGLHLVAVWLIAELGCPGPLSESGGWGVSWVAWLIIAVTVVFFLLASVCSLMSWRLAASSDDGFLPRVGQVANPLFMFVIIVQSLPVFFFLSECGSYIT